MLPNRLTLDGLRERKVDELALLPPDQLAMTLEDVIELKARAKALDDKIVAVLDRKYGDQAKALRENKGVNTGTVRLDDGEFVVTADLPKKVGWSDAGLAEVEAKLLADGKPVQEYIAIKRTVPERGYTNWPSDVRALFEPHRTLSTGRPSFTIERAKGR